MNDILHAYDEQRLGELLELREAARVTPAARAALRDRVATFSVKDGAWRKVARDQLRRLEELSAPEVILSGPRTIAEPRAVVLASLDAGDLPQDLDVASLAEVARVPFPGRPGPLVFALDPEQRTQGVPGESMLRTETLRAVVGSRSPALRGVAIEALQDGPFAPNTFHDANDAARACEILRAAPSREAPTLEELCRFGFHEELPEEREEREAQRRERPHPSWLHGAFVAAAAQAAVKLARFHARCARARCAVWVELEEMTPEDFR